MKITPIDWLVVAAYFAINLLIGLYYRKKASASTGDFFVSGREVTWWLAGTSMVATTFAADTPLAVTGLVARQGIAGNWLWWSLLLNGMMTVFFFARLWRRAEIITDAELVELRYAGKPAALLRGFRALYFGVLMNCLVVGWVNLAMEKILQTALGVSKGTALAHHLRDGCLHRLLHFDIGAVGRALDGCCSVCSQDDDGDCAGLLRRPGRGGDGIVEDETGRP